MAFLHPGAQPLHPGRRVPPEQGWLSPSDPLSPLPPLDLADHKGTIRRALGGAHREGMPVHCQLTSRRATTAREVYEFEMANSDSAVTEMPSFHRKQHGDTCHWRRREVPPCRTARRVGGASQHLLGQAACQHRIAGKP